MKGILRTILGISIAYPSGSLAQVDLPPPPPLQDYMAYRAEPAPVHERVQDAMWFLRGWYLSTQAAYSFVRVTGIRNVAPVTPPNQAVPPLKTNITQNVWSPVIGIGYQWRKSGFLDRFELSYMPRWGIDYNARPFLTPASVDSFITSKINSQVVLLKGYWDFDFDCPFVPFIEAGAGFVSNSVSGNATLNIIPGIVTFQSPIADSEGSFAWDVGFGARYFFTPEFALTAGYEFDWLGQAKWNMNFVSPQFRGAPPLIVRFRSRNIYANTLMAGLVWIPFPRDFVAEAEAADP